MAEDMEAYVAYMEQYCDSFDEIVTIWQHKYEVISTNALHELEAQSKREEAAMLKARGLEKKRLALQAKLGYPQATLETLIEQTTGETQQRLRDVKTRLNWAVTMLKNLNDSCAVLTEQKLVVIQSEIGRLNGKVDETKRGDGKTVMNRSI